MSSDFLTALTETLSTEGWWSNNPRDPGGETWRGVARNRHPTWPGWAVVDARRGEPDFPQCLRGDERLRGLVESFYRAEFWELLGLDQLDDQRIAAKLFDMAVNMSPARAVRCLQKAINYLVPRPMEVSVDGRIGPLTLAAVRAQPPKRLFLALCGYHFCYYAGLIEDPNTADECFAPGWLARALAHTEEED